MKINFLSMEKIFFVAIYLLIALAVGMGIVILHLLLSEKPKTTTKEKYLPFESGMVPFHDARGRLPVKFYIFALAFLIFDIEVALLFPYVPLVKELGKFGLAEILFFFTILFLAYIYIRETALKEWK